MLLEGLGEPVLLKVIMKPYQAVIVIENYRPFLPDDEMWEYLEKMFTNVLENENIKIILRRCGNGFCGEKIVYNEVEVKVDTPQPTVGALLWRFLGGGDDNGKEVEEEGD